MLLRITIIILSAAVLWGWVSKPMPVEPLPVVKNSTNPHVQAWVDDCAAQVQAQLKQFNIPGAALAITYKDQVFIRTFGYRSLETKEPIDEHSVFRIASLSKSFAGVLTAKLVQEKRMHWNNYVADYIPEFKLADAAQTNRVQLKHLLSHTSGLPYHTYTNLVEANLPMSKIIPQLKSVKLVGKEGTVYSYQNAPFSIIGEVHQKATGQSYEDLLKEKIFNPIGMYDSSTDFQSIRENTNTALPHKRKKNGWYTSSISKKYYNAVPAGGVNASIHDMATYIRLLLGYYPHVLTKSDLDPVFEPMIKTPVKRRYFSNWPKLNTAHYGLGWRILDYSGQEIAYHSGYVNSYKGELAIDRNEEIGFCLLMNAPGKCAKKTVPIFLDTYAQYKDQIGSKGAIHRPLK